MTQLLVKDAATRVGITRQTMFRHIREGKVTATLNHKGQKQIEVSELLRVFGEIQTETDAASGKPYHRTPRRVQPATDTELQIELERLRARLEFKEAALSMAEERIAELKKSAEAATQERQKMWEMLERQTLLLAAPKPEKKGRAEAPKQKAGKKSG